MCELRTMRDRGDDLRVALAGSISPAEIEALRRRIAHFADTGRYPALSPRRNIPYGWW
jgi:hypothetical protein